LYSVADICLHNDYYNKTIVRVAKPTLFSYFTQKISHGT